MHGAESSPESGDDDARTRRQLLAARRRPRRAAPRRSASPTTARWPGSGALQRAALPAYLGAIGVAHRARWSPGCWCATAPVLAPGHARRGSARCAALLMIVPGLRSGGRDDQPADQRIDAAGPPAAAGVRDGIPPEHRAMVVDPGDADRARDRPRARPPTSSCTTSPTPSATRSSRCSPTGPTPTPRATPATRPCSTRAVAEIERAQRALPGAGRRAAALHRPAPRAAPVADRSSAGSAGSASAASSSS